MHPPYFPVKFSDLEIKKTYLEACPGPFEIGSVTVSTIPLSHPNGGTGFKFMEDGKTFVYLTDNELGFVHPGGLPKKAYQDFSAGVDLLIHDAEFNQIEYNLSRGWGHTLYTDTVDIACNAGVKNLGLFHLNQERTDRQQDEIVKICKQSIADRGLDIDCFAVGSDMVFEL